MPAAMMLYSIAVVADSSLRKRLTSANIVLPPSSVDPPAMRGNLKANCCQDFSAKKPALAALRSETPVSVWNATACLCTKACLRQMKLAGSVVALPASRTLRAQGLRRT
jgi:hypothetical protein